MSLIEVSELLDRKNIRLAPHPTAREKAEATSLFLPGSPILTVPSLVTVLLPEAKGQRCDYCHRLSTPDKPLRKCTGCASYWYCNTMCQNLQWKAHHKVICKAYNSFTVSHDYQALPSHAKMDSMLLSHLLAYLKLNDNGIESHPISQMSIFLSLLPGPEADQPPVCGKLPVNDAYKLFARFGNNNFAVHSHLTTYGHGIFPLASRIFNHSCYPNAAAKYVISEARQVTMEIVALREIHTGEEICIPYLDPALTQTRHLILEHSYGFKCGCSSCQLFGGIHQEARPPSDATERLALARNLREFANVDPFENLSLWCRLPSSIPPRLQPAFHEEFLTYLSDTFSEASHEGDYQLALKSGLSIFAFYSMVYPPNYPQIGMHLLELAKTAWNETILHPESSTIQLNEQVRTMLMLANQVLVIYGPEGDEEGPLKEVEVMQRLLSTS